MANRGGAIALLVIFLPLLSSAIGTQTGPSVFSKLPASLKLQDVAARVLAKAQRKLGDQSGFPISHPAFFADVKIQCHARLDPLGFNSDVAIVRNPGACSGGVENDACIRGVLEAEKKCARYSREKSLGAFPVSSRYVTFSECVYRSMATTTLTSKCRWACGDSNGEPVKCFDYSQGVPKVNMTFGEVDREVGGALRGLTKVMSHEDIADQHKKNTPYFCEGKSYEGFNREADVFNHHANCPGYTEEEIDCRDFGVDAVRDCVYTPHIWTYYLFTDCAIQKLKESGAWQKCLPVCETKDADPRACFGNDHSSPVPPEVIDENTMCQPTLPTGFNAEVKKMKHGYSCGYTGPQDDSDCNDMVLQFEELCWQHADANYTIITDCVVATMNEMGVPALCRWSCEDKDGSEVTCFGNDHSPGIPGPVIDESVMCGKATQGSGGFNKAMVDVRPGLSCGAIGPDYDDECDVLTSAAVADCRVAPDASYTLLSECVLKTVMAKGQVEACRWTCVDGGNTPVSCYGTDHSAPYPGPVIDESKMCGRVEEVEGFNKAVNSVKAAYSCGGMGPEEDARCGDILRKVEGECIVESQRNKYTLVSDCVYAEVKRRESLNRCRWSCADVSGVEVACFGSDHSREVPGPVADEEFMCERQPVKGFNTAAVGSLQGFSCGALGPDEDDKCDAALKEAETKCQGDSSDVNYFIPPECLYSQMKNQGLADKCRWSCRRSKNDYEHLVKCYGNYTHWEIPGPVVDESEMCKVEDPNVAGFNAAVVDAKGYSCGKNGLLDEVFCRLVVMDHVRKCRSPEREDANYTLFSDCLYHKLDCSDQLEICRWSCVDDEGRKVSCYGHDFSDERPTRVKDEEEMCDASISADLGFNSNAVNLLSAYSCGRVGPKEDRECVEKMKDVEGRCVHLLHDEDEKKKEYAFFSECLLGEVSNRGLVEQCGWSCVDKSGEEVACYGNDVPFNFS